jgi:hypothetical protein
MNNLFENTTNTTLKIFLTIFHKTIFNKCIIVRNKVSSLVHNKSLKSNVDNVILNGKKINIINNISIDKKLEYFNYLNFGSINQQATLYGGKFYLLNTNIIRYDNVFNPSIIKYNNKLFMTFRVHTNLLSRKIYFCEVDNNLNILNVSDNIIDDIMNTYYEDARLFIYDNKLYINFIEYYFINFRVNFGKIVPKKKVKSILETK